MDHNKKLLLAESILGRSAKDGREYLFYCPLCKHHKPKMSLNFEKDVYKCWVCENAGRSIRRLISRYGSSSQIRQWDELSGIVDLLQGNFEEKITDFFSNDDEKKEKKYEKQILQLPSEFVSLANKDNKREAITCLNYLYKRGITQDTVIRWKMGYCDTGEYSGRIIIPSFDLEGDVNFFVGRSYMQDEKFPYKQPSVAKAPLIFNELNVDWDADVVIVEGVFDAIKAENAIPILGSSLSVETRLFSEIMRHDTPVYFALDPDAFFKTIKIIESCLAYDIEAYFIDIGDYKDVGDMTREEFLVAKKNAVYMTPSVILEQKIKNIF